MNTCLYKHNLNSLSTINDWTPILLNNETKYIDHDTRYLTSFRTITPISIKSLYELLKQCFQHYMILVEFPIHYSSNKQSIKDTKNKYIHFIEMANQGLLKVYNYYHYYKYQDAHLLKDMNLKNSIQLNQLKSKFSNESCIDDSIFITPTHYFNNNNNDKTTINTTNSSKETKEMNKEYFFNTNKIFNFLNYNNSNTLKNPSNLQPIFEDTTVHSIRINNTVTESNTDDLNENPFNNDITKNPISIQPSLQCSGNGGGSSGNGSSGDGSSGNGSSGDGSSGNGSSGGGDDNNSQQRNGFGTAQCVHIIKDMYQNVCFFFSSIKKSVINNFNYYFRNSSRSE